MAALIDRNFLNAVQVQSVRRYVTVNQQRCGNENLVRNPCTCIWPMKFCALAVGILAFLCQSAHAAEPGVAIRYFTKVPAGTVPRVEFEARVPMSQLLVKLQRDDGKTVNQGFGPMGRGDKVSLPLEGAPGKHAYKGQVIIGQGGAEETSSVAFETFVTDNLVVKVNKPDIDLALGQLKLTASRAIARVDVTVFSSLNTNSGKKVSQTISDNDVGQPVVIKFPVVPEGIARLDIVVTDTQGFYSGVSVLPWSVSIPHEEVIFETDKSDIAVNEQPKLDQSAKRIADAFASARALGPVQLFIAGHTDTVGNDAYNLKLSLARAQSIARYLRKKGLRLPILFEGFGERSLRVGTSDETDAPRNRRVDYILALEPPDFGTGARWKKLP